MRVTLIPPVPELTTVHIDLTVVEAQQLRAILGGMADCSNEGTSSKLYDLLGSVPGKKLSVEWGVDLSCSRSIRGFAPREW